MTNPEDQPVSCDQHDTYDDDCPVCKLKQHLNENSKAYEIMGEI